jgi:hypothetical protein
VEHLEEERHAGARSVGVGLHQRPGGGAIDPAVTVLDHRDEGGGCVVDVAARDGFVDVGRK